MLTIASLPALGQALDAGVFAGITTKPDGSHHAVVLLQQQGTDLTWKDAITWAKDLGGELPSRPVAALLFANVKDQLQPRWHWTSEEYGASYAWGCDFSGGNQFSNRKSYEGSAVAVRLIPLAA